MTTQRWQNGLLVVALLAAGVVAWGLELRPTLQVDASPLDAVPRTLAGWTAQDVPLDQTVERLLRADHNIQRVYTHPTGDVIWLYVGYYGTERGGRTEHAPEVCYPSAGWTILAERSRVVNYGNSLRANELVVEREGQRRLVHYWYQSHRADDLLGGFDQTLDRLVGRLVNGRADGAFVRLSTPLDSDDPSDARARLAAFASDMNPTIASHWPDETPAPTS